ncbi:hypothetical protein [Amycolatopsis sp. NPDC098790]|uniref:hypothetical protein n=1 Tax=Amycolatopsis sp. NPDC098790 TaxID=3363939 RepID=UPI00382C4ABC
MITTRATGRLICVTSEVDERRSWAEDTYGAAALVPLIGPFRTVTGAVAARRYGPGVR